MDGIFISGIKKNILLNKKNVVVLDYFDKGLSYKYKKRIVNYLKTKYSGVLVVISNDIVDVSAAIASKMKNIMQKK